VSPPLQPEFFTLLGIDLFLALSLLTCLQDEKFPWALPYLYQLAALTGFGHMLISHSFLSSFSQYMRFWYSVAYLTIALGNIAALNLYLMIIKKLIRVAQVYLLLVTTPALAFSTLFLSSYAEIATHPLIILPTFTVEHAFLAMVAFDTFVVSTAIYIFFKPKWQYLASGALAIITGSAAYTFLKPQWGETTFLIAAIALAIACLMVLGASLYILARIWVENLKEKEGR
jgi:hypothetical protein